MTKTSAAALFASTLLSACTVVMPPAEVDPPCTDSECQDSSTGEALEGSTGDSSGLEESTGDLEEVTSSGSTGSTGTSTGEIPEGSSTSGSPDQTTDEPEGSTSSEGDTSTGEPMPDPICGNLIVEAGEACDDGNGDSTDACALCKPAACGDGFVQEGVEECDDGNEFSEDGCESDCKVSTDACGNPSTGTLWLEVDWSKAQFANKPSFRSSPQMWVSDWAWGNENGPQVNDDNSNVTIAGMGELGSAAKIDASWQTSSLTLLFGLTKLKSYSGATLCVEGRSAHYEKEVIFQTSLSNSGGTLECQKGPWGELGTLLPQIYTSNLGLQTCLNANDWLETINFRPKDGSKMMFLKRVRLSFHDPVLK
jgi:cysteine-rich repeat protein